MSYTVADVSALRKAKLNSILDAVSFSYVRFARARPGVRGKTYVPNNLWDVKRTHILFEKSRAGSPRCGGLSLSDFMSFTSVIHVSSKYSGLIAAATNAFTCLSPISPHKRSVNCHKTMALLKHEIIFIKNG